jgi:glycosidase
MIAFVALLMIAAVFPVVANAGHTPDPLSVAVVGNLQDELGCPGDWQPECTISELVYDAGDGVLQATFSLPAGSYEYKAALNDSWDENYGADATRDGANIALVLAAPSDVKFYYDHETHWITDNVNSVIATVPGSFQSALGCSDNWDPGCLLSWLQDPDGDGVYGFSTDALPAGDYEAKVTIDESWDENYGLGGVANGPNIPFSVPAGATVSFSYEAVGHILTINVAAAALIAPPVRSTASDEVFYFVLPDRFADGDASNNTGGDSSGDPLVNGFLPEDKGYYHGGDLAGLTGKLDYLQGLGVTAIWMTPQFTNRWVQGDGTIGGSSAGYHGYWQVDYETIDPHFGTNAEMVALIDAAHARGMKVFFDVVLNHTGDVITYAEGTFTYRNKTDYPYQDADGVLFDDRDYAGGDTFPTLDPAVSFPYTPVFSTAADATAKNPGWLNDPIYYHNRGDSTFTGENSLYGDFFGLDDLFTEHPEVVEGMIDIHKNMITTFGIDGFRVDTVKHVNDELWEQFVPEILAYAEAQGITDFFVFGEVFSGDPAFAGRYSTELPFPSVLDFGFDGAAKQFASASAATDILRDFFASDDWYTDEDSNVHQLVKFVGNHDVGRLGFDIDVANPGASDAERLGRARLAYALAYFTRGIPLVYYGDEQGFVGDGGDKDARQDMMPSLVASYNDDDLIGTAATTADDNFDPTHPLYQAFTEFANLRGAHPALSQGAQLHRYSQNSAGIYAFSRVDRTEQVEYVVALNNSESAATASFATLTPDTTFTAVSPGGAATLTSDAAGSVTLTVPGLDFVIYRADTALPPATITGLLLTNPTDGGTVSGRTEVGADVGGAGLHEVTFSVSVDGDPFEVIGTDDSAPYRVFFDTSDLPIGTALVLQAAAIDTDAALWSDQVSVTVADEAPPGEGPTYAVIHYLRDGGDYGDHTTGDYNDYWGLHLWGDVDEVIEWTSPKPFLGEDEYGRFAWVKLAQPDPSNVGFIVHRGDIKDGTTADRFFDPSATPEIWLRNDDATTYTSQAEAQGYVTIHYQRPDADYTDWGLHLWGDAIDPSEGTSWTSPKPPTGIDTFGAYWDVLIQDATQPVNFIIHRGDDKDPGPDQAMVPVEDASIWIMSGNETIYPSRGAAEDVATIHYHRADGDYGDSTSSDFNDFWGLHVWAGALNPNPGWTDPVRWTELDVFGPVFEVELVDDAPELAYIIHRGDTKDPGPDQFLMFDEWGYEVWQLEGEHPSGPDQPHYVLPVPDTGFRPQGNLGEQRAHWVSEDTIVWNPAPGGTSFDLVYAPTGGLSMGDTGISGGTSVSLTPAGPFDPTVTSFGREGFDHLTGLPTFIIDDTSAVTDILAGQVAVLASGDLGRVDATGLQIS